MSNERRSPSDLVRVKLVEYISHGAYSNHNDTLFNTRSEMIVIFFIYLICLRFGITGRLVFHFLSRVSSDVMQQKPVEAFVSVRSSVLLAALRQCVVRESQI